MSFDERIRQSLRQTADTVDADVERSLHRVLEGRRQPPRRRRALAVATATLAAIVVTSAVPWTRRMLSDVDPAAGGSLAGQYQVTLRPADVAGVDPAMAGTWRMRLRPDGTLDLTAPEPFQGRTSVGASCTDLSVPCRYGIAGDTLQTNLVLGTPGPACNAIGTYSFRLADRRLTLSAIDDQCRSRRTLLATRAWRDLTDPRLPEGTYRTARLGLAQLQAGGADAVTFWRDRGVTRDATYRFRFDDEELRFDGLATECAAGRARLAAVYESAPFRRQP